MITIGNVRSYLTRRTVPRSEQDARIQQCFERPPTYSVTAGGELRNKTLREDRQEDQETGNKER